MQDLTQALDGTTNVNSGINANMLTTLMMYVTIGSVILTIVFLIYMLMNIMKRWKSEKAMVAMAADIHEIRTLLEKTAARGDVQPVVSDPAQLQSVVAGEKSSDKELIQ